MGEYLKGTKYYGHSGKSPDYSDWQTLKEHLEKVAQKASIFGDEFGAADIAYLAGIYHDIGKYSDAFQRRLRGSSVPVDHSTAGAKECEQKYGPLYGRMLAYIIAGHHGGMPGWDDGGNRCLRSRLKKEVDDYSEWADEISIPDHINYKMIEFKMTRNELPFFLINRTRMIFSCLVDADYLDTEKAFGSIKSGLRDEIYDMRLLNEKLSDHLQKFRARTERNTTEDMRMKLLDDCINKSHSSRGLYSLNAPTGSGKTLSSLAFALNHAATHNMKRVIYVIPYTSIIEQNAAVFSRVMGKEYVLEHHSSFDYEKGQVEDSNEVENLKYRLGTENWSFPIIVTTNIQFFESFFSNKPGKVRKLHNIANAVIVLDEAQMLPSNLLIPTSALLNDLVKHYNSTVVLCTATQPELRTVFPELDTMDEIVSSPQELYKKMKRVELSYSSDNYHDHVLVEQLNSYHQVLCIVNTRKHAFELFGLLDNPDGQVFHLSARMTPIHRSQVIDKIKSRLMKNEKCIVVSTPVVEAGVDLDFPVVFRALAGLDSIAQAAGRCNREGKIEKGQLIVFNPESLGRAKGYLGRLSSKTESIMRRYEDPLSLEALEEYFRSVYTTAGEELDAKNIMDLHKQATVHNELRIPFREIAENYKVIEDEMVSIVIPFINIEASEDQSEYFRDQQRQIDALIKQITEMNTPNNLESRLQKFTVQIYRSEYTRLDLIGAVWSIGRFIFLKDPAYYDARKGILLEN